MDLVLRSSQKTGRCDGRCCRRAPHTKVPDSRAEVRAVPNGDVGSRIVVSVDDSKRFEWAIDESNPELELVRLTDAGLDVALRMETASQTADIRECERAIVAAQLSPAATADLCERVIEHAEAWLTRDDRIAPIVGVGWTDVQQSALRTEDEHRREQVQADLIRDGNWLTAALVAHGLDPTPLLTMLNHTKASDCLSGANAEKSEWSQIKVALQRAAIQLQLRKGNQSAGCATSYAGAPDSPPDEAPPAQPSKRKRGGRKPSTDRAADRHIAEEWAAGRFKTYAELDRELGLPQGDAERAVDRHRHRTPKKPRKD